MFFFQAEDGIRDLVRSRGLGDVYKRQAKDTQGVLASTVAGKEEGIGTVRYGGAVGSDLHYLSLIHI